MCLPLIPMDRAPRDSVKLYEIIPKNLQYLCVFLNYINALLHIGTGRKTRWTEWMNAGDHNMKL